MGGTQFNIFWKETKDDEPLTFAGVSYQKIVEAYEKKNGTLRATSCHHAPV